MRDDEEFEGGGEGAEPSRETQADEAQEEEVSRSADSGPGRGRSGRMEEEGQENPLRLPACGVRSGQASTGSGRTESGEAAAAREGSTAEGDDGPERIHANRNRELQVARTGGRRLFDGEAKALFLEWFAATCNAAWSAELAGFNYKTVWKHRMRDPAFAEACDRAEEQAVARLRAKQLETKRKPLAIGVEGDWDAPEMDDVDPILAATLLREHDRRTPAGRPRRAGLTPRVASNAEVRAALVKRLAVYGVRVFGEPPAPQAGEE